ncbi:FlgD immunoglobulin-like domain containing protein [candidate division KSB1 bacterium]
MKSNYFKLLTFALVFSAVTLLGLTPNANAQYTMVGDESLSGITIGAERVIVTAGNVLTINQATTADAVNISNITVVVTTAGGATKGVVANSAGTPTAKSIEFAAGATGMITMTQAITADSLIIGDGATVTFLGTAALTVTNMAEFGPGGTGTTVLDVDAATTITGAAAFHGNTDIDLAAAISFSAQCSLATGKTLDFIASAANPTFTGGLNVGDGSTVSLSAAATMTFIGDLNFVGQTGTIDAVAGGDDLTHTGDLTNVGSGTATTITFATLGDYVAGGDIILDEDLTFAGALGATFIEGGFTGILTAGTAGDSLTFDPGSNMTITAGLNLGGTGGELILDGAAARTLTTGAAVVILNDVTLDGADILDDGGAGVTINAGAEFAIRSTGAWTTAGIANSGTLTYYDGGTAGTLPTAAIVLATADAVLNINANVTLTPNPSLTPSGGGTLFINAGNTLVAPNAIQIGDDKLFTISGTGTLTATGGITTVGGGGSKLKLSSVLGAALAAVTTGATTDTVDVDAANTITALDVGSNGGTLDLAAALTLGGNIAMANGTTVIIEGAGPLAQAAAPVDITVGGGTAATVQTLTITGALTDSLGVIQINNDNAGATNIINLGDDNKFEDLDFPTDPLTINFTAFGKTLTVGLPIASFANTLTIGGNNGWVLDGVGNLTNGGEVQIDNFGTINKDMDINGGLVDVNEQLTFGGDLSISGAAEFAIASGTNLTYSGSAIDVGAFTVTLSEIGVFDNGSIALNLNDAGANLDFTAAATIDKVTSANNGAQITVTDDATISSMSGTTAGFEVSFPTGMKTLTLSSGVTLPDAATITLLSSAANGLLAGGQIDITGDGSGFTNNNDGGTNVIANNIVIGGSDASAATFTSNDILKLTGTLTTNDRATISFATAGVDTLAGNVILNGSCSFDADMPTLITGDITITCDSSVTFDGDAALTYTGPAIVVPASVDSLIFAGTGAFANAAPPDSGTIKLTSGTFVKFTGTGSVNDITIENDGVELAVDGANAQVDSITALTSSFGVVFNTANNLTINDSLVLDQSSQKLTISGYAAGNLKGTGRITLTGANAEIENTFANASINKDIFFGNADPDNPAVVTATAAFNVLGTMTLNGSGTLDIPGTLNYLGSAFSIDDGDILTLAGGGTFINTSNITLDHANGTLAFGAGGMSLSAVEYLAEGATIKINGGDGSITTLTNGGKNLNFEFATDDSLYIGAFGSALAADTINISGAGAGAKFAGADFVLTADTRLTIGSDILMYNNLTVIDTITIASDFTLKGDLTMNPTTTTWMNFTNDAIMTYTGSDVSVGAKTLMVNGAGRIANSGFGAISLDDDAATLMFSGAVTVDTVEIADTMTGTVDVEESGTIGSLTTNTNSNGSISFSGVNQTLNIGTQVYLAADDTLSIADGEKGTIAGGVIDLTGASTSLKIDNTKATTISSTINLGAGYFDVNTDSVTVDGDMVMEASGTIDVAASKSLVYEGSEILVGDKTLTIQGGGRFDNTNAVVLDSSSSVLTLATALDTVASVSVGDKDATIDVDGNAAIEALAVTAGGVKLDAAATLYLTGATTLPGSSVVTVMGAGTVAGATDADSSNALTFTATDTLRVTANNGVVTKKVMMTGGIMDFGSVTTGYDFAARTFFDGDIVIWNGAKNVDFTGDLTVATASTVTDTGDPSGMVKLGDGTNINLLDNLTMEKSMVRIDYALGFTSEGAADTVTLQIDSVDFDNGLAKFGTDAADGEPIRIMSNLTKSLITLPSTVDFAGSTILVDDDTLLVEEVATINGNLVMNGTGELHIQPVAADPGITLNATLQAINGTLEIDSVGSTSQGGIDFDTGGIYKVVDATGKIVLPRTKTTDLAGSAATNVIVIQSGVIEGSGTQSLGDPKHTIANADNDKVATMESGTINNIDFSTNVIAFTRAGNNVTGYFITVYVSVLEGDDTDGTGSEVAPYATFEKGLAEAEDGSIIALAYGEYVLSAALAVDKQITFQGYDVKFGTLGNSGALGANDLAPTITFAGTGDYLFDVQTTDVKFQGIKFNAPSVTSLFTFSTADTTINNFTLDGNNFTMSDGQVGVALTTAVGVKGVAITDNMFDIAAAGDMSTVLTLSTTMVDSADGVTITGNTIKGSQIMFDLGDAADIDVVTITGNTFMDGAGIMFDESVDQSTKMINDVTITGNTFKGNMSNAVMLSTDIEITDVDGTMNNDFDLTDNHFFFTGTAITNGVTATNDSTVHKVAATDNWWGSFGGPAAGYATYTGAVEYIEWKYVPVLAGGEVITTEVASATAYTGFDITVFSGTAGYYTVSTNFAADFAAGPHVITANNPDALTDNTITITPTDINGFTGGVVTVELNDGAGNVYTATSNTFDVAAATVSPIGSALTATDFPGDAGGYVQLSFVASPNHAGFGTAVDGLLIDYYQIYRASVDDFGQAVNWAYFVATPKATGQNDTLRVVVDTKGATGTAFYWIAAVKGNLPVVATKAAQVNGVLAAFSVEETPATASFKTATVGDDGRITSSVSNSNRALPVDNNRGAGDWTGAVGVGLDDFAAFVGVYDVADEYDVVFDLDVDGAIGLSDFAAFVTHYFASTASASKVRPVMESGLNKEGSLEAKTDFDFDTEYLDLTVTADDIKSLTGYGYRLDFDPTVYELVEIVNGDLLRSNGGDVGPMLKHIHNGTIVVAEVLTGLENAAQGEGIITTFRFRWIGDDNSSINISNIDLLDGNSEITHFEDILVEKPVALPVDYQLMDNYPNPFNPTTTISFALPVTEHVKIEVCNVLGQTIRTLVDTEMKAGVRTVKWDGRNDYGIQASTGIYFYRIQAGSFTEAKKMNLIK